MLTADSTGSSKRGSRLSEQQTIDCRHNQATHTAAQSIVGKGYYVNEFLSCRLPTFHHSIGSWSLPTTPRSMLPTEWYHPSLPEFVSVLKGGLRGGGIRSHRHNGFDGQKLPHQTLNPLFCLLLGSKVVLECRLQEFHPLLILNAPLLKAGQPARTSADSEASRQYHAAASALFGS